MNQVLLYIKAITGEVFSKASLKTIGAIIYIIGQFFYSGLNKDALIGLFVLIVVDFILGIAYSKKRGITIEPKRMFGTPIKILVYYGMIACGHMVEFGLPHAIQFVDDAILTFLLGTEFVSIMKHFAKLGYKTPTKILNMVEDITEKQ